MGVQNMSLLTGSTVAVTGGTAQNFVGDNQKVPNGTHVVDSSVSDPRIRPYCTLKAKPATEQSDGSFNKDFRSVMLVRPFIDSKGKVQYDYVRFERALHPESTWVADHRKMGAQLAVDTDLDLFFSVGSMV